ncbi:MAG: DUF456 domain-containing protein [Actinobacteria bacterium]|nr:DUF456 domain-containing protein [Micrococcales bacterium]MCB0904147.1 DUF456 domain-containing protein [Actinomycetota bacterium]MCO5299849.1 DUF456 domain-containing protein [Candidatus Nanopelagicales bacterium]MCB9429678.1 DUF456 domain-containing protein [Actinomycetota bacterium]HPE13105.1 DUF456 domain-containing protein [Actinomycetota bacterium]
MTNALVALAIVVGLFGTIVPILPGALLVAGAIGVWAILTGGTTAWAVAIGALAIIAAGQLLKYLVPGRQMKASGVPTWVLLIGALAGIVGFFVIPIVGLVVGFLAGVFVSEAVRLGTVKGAWPTTMQAMKSAGWSVLIEFGSALLAAALWAASLVLVL